LGVPQPKVGIVAAAGSLGCAKACFFSDKNSAYGSFFRLAAQKTPPFCLLIFAILSSIRRTPIGFLSPEQLLLKN
jgi:hypothetical protein